MKKTQKLLSFLLSMGMLFQSIPAVYSAEEKNENDIIDLCELAYTTTGSEIVYNKSIECTYSDSTVNHTFEKALRQDTVDNIKAQLEMSSLNFDITDMLPFGGVFSAYPGMQSKDSRKWGDAIYIVYADGKEIARSGVVSYKSTLSELTAQIPAGTEKLTLAVDCYDDTACDWSVWGEPKIKIKESSFIYLTELSATKENEVLYSQGELKMLADYQSGSYETYKNGIFYHAATATSEKAALVYDVSAFTAKGAVFSTDFGFLYDYNGSAIGPNGSVSFNFYADNTLITKSAEVTVQNSPVTSLTAQIPSGTKKIKLEIDPGSSNTYDWAMFGDARIMENLNFISVSCDKQYIKVNENAQISVSVKIADGTYAKETDYSVTYRSSDASVATVDENGVVAGISNGTFEIYCTVICNGVTNVKTIKLNIGVPDAVKYLSDMTPSSKTAAAFANDTGYDGQPLNFMNAGNSITFEKGVFAHAPSKVSYNISGMGAKCFKATIGINRNEGFNESSSSSAVFEVYIDGELKFRSDEKKINSPAEDICVDIPYAAKTLTLVGDPGTSNSCDHTTWANARIEYDGEFDKKIKKLALSADKTEIALNETVNVSVTGVLNSGEVLDTSLAEISYVSGASEYITVTDDGMIRGVSDGRARVTAYVKYLGDIYTASLYFACGDVKNDKIVYLSDMDIEYSSVGSGTLKLDSDLEGNKIHFENDGEPLQFEKGIFAHAASEVVFDITGYPIVAFSAFAGVNASINMNELGSVIFEVYADDNLVYNSAPLDRESKVAEISVEIPWDTKKLRLVGNSNGSISSDHAAWGDAKLILDGNYLTNIISLEAEISSEFLEVGENAYITVNGKYADGSSFSQDDVKLSYASDDESVVTVSADGKISAVSNGIANIEISAEGKGNVYKKSVLVVVGDDKENELFNVKSPDGRHKAIIWLDGNGTVNYTSLFNGEVAVRPSSLGIDTDIADFTYGLKFKDISSPVLINETYSISAHNEKTLLNHAYERVLSFEKNGEVIGITVRAYNDGIALRYNIASSKNKNITIKNEYTEIALPQNGKLWAMDYCSFHELPYNEYSSNGVSGKFSVPLIAQNVDTDIYTMVTEADMNPEYCGVMAVANSGTSLMLGKCISENKNITVSSVFESPWRIVVTGELSDIYESSMVTDVSDNADKNIDWSFVTTGVSSWSWLEEGFSGQKDSEVHKKYIDFSAEMGWEYYTLDYGWQIYEGGNTDGFYEALPDSYYDWTKEIVDYANSRGVKLIAWVHKKSLLDEENRNKLLEGYAEMGFSGIKADFFESEDQSHIKLFDDLYKKCAELGLVANFHGINKPTGEVRKYPNVIAREAVRGEEYRTYSPAMQAKMLTVFPFTRCVAGPTDITEGVIPRGGNETTAGSQVALSTLITSGIHYISSSPEELRSSPAYGYYKNLPVVFDDTELLGGEIGEYITVARKTGGDIYISGITVSGRTESIPLNMLGDGIYRAEILCDGDDRMTLLRDVRAVSKNDVIEVSMLENGGFAIKLTPVENEKGPDSIILDQKELVLEYDETKKLSAEISGNDITLSDVSFEADNKEIVSTLGGNIKAKAPGKTTVRAYSLTDRSVFDSCVVNVKRSPYSTPAFEVGFSKEKYSVGEKVIASFTSDRNGFSILSSGFSEIPYEIISLSDNGNGFDYMISFTADDSGVYSLVDEKGTEFNFFALPTEITVSFDGKDATFHITGETIELPALSPDEEKAFCGWEYGGKIYSSNKAFKIPADAKNIDFTSVFANIKENVIVYVDSENGNDNNSGLAHNDAYLTLEGAFAKLESFASDEKTVQLLCDYTLSDDALPKNSDMIIIDGGNKHMLYFSSEGITLSGDITFKNIGLVNEYRYKHINTYGHKLVIGENVDTSKSAISLLIHSGTMNKSGGRECVEIHSGKFEILSGAYYNVKEPHTTDGADYTVYGGEVMLNFVADSFAATHHGVTFTDSVNIKNYGGKLTVNVTSTAQKPVLFEKPVSVISNYGSETKINSLSECAEDAVYIINASQCGRIDTTDENGVFEVTAFNGYNAFEGSKKLGTSFTAENGKIHNIYFNPIGAAKIGDRVYETLEEAFVYAKKGDTAKLIDNLALDSDITVPEGVTLDFGVFVVNGVNVLISDNSTVLSDNNISDFIRAYDYNEEKHHFSMMNHDKRYSYILSESYVENGTLYIESENAAISKGLSGNSVCVECSKDGKIYEFTAENDIPVDVTVSSLGLYPEISLTLDGADIASLYGMAGDISTDITVILKDGNVFGSVYAGINCYTDSTFELKLSGGKISGDIYCGAYAESKDSHIGSVNILLGNCAYDALYTSGRADSAYTSLIDSVRVEILSSEHLNIYKNHSDRSNAEKTDIINTSGSIFTGWKDNTAKFCTLSMEGVQIRTSGKQGLRFIATLGGDSENISSYGIIAMPKHLLEGKELTLDTPLAKIVSSDNTGFKLFEKNEDALKYTVCITGIPPYNYSRDYSVRAYVKYKDANGNEKTVYCEPACSDILSAVTGLKNQYPSKYDGLYETLYGEFSKTYVSSSEFGSKVKEYSKNAERVITEGFTEKGAVATGKASGSTRGEVYELYGWMSTDYIETEDYTLVQYAVAANPDIYSVSFFDSDKAFISGVTTTNAEKPYFAVCHDIEIPDGARYVKLANFVGTESNAAFELCRAGLYKDVGKAVNEYAFIKDTKNLEGKKIVCVGDSLTYGDYGSFKHGQGNPKNENYPYYLAKYLGANVEWYAWGGYTPTLLLPDYSNGHFSGKLNKNIDITDADYVIVMLGTNDGLTLNGDTHYDSYKRLLEKMISDIGEDTQIVLCTPPHATADSTKVNFGYADNVANAYGNVLKLAESFGLPVIDVYKYIGFSSETETIMQPNDGLHFGKIGYSTLAAFIGNHIKQLEYQRFGEMNAEEAELGADKEFLDSIKYPKFELSDGEYKTLGRWFKKEINGIEHDVTLTDGAELYFMTNGATTFTVDFTVITTKATPYFAVSIDGKEPVRHLITESTVTLPDASRHAVRIIADGLTETEGKWKEERGFAIKDIYVNAGKMKAIYPTNDIIFYYGDSITEGINAFGTSGNSNTNSATNSYAYHSAKELEAIPYIIGYGGTGVLSVGSFNTFIKAIDNLSQARADTDTTVPDKIIVNHGTNDHSYSSEIFTAELHKALSRLCEKYPDTPVYYVIPFGQYHAQDIRKAVLCYDNIKLIESGDFALTYSDGVHPDAKGAKKAGELIAKQIKKTDMATEKYAKYTYYRGSLQNTFTSLTNDKELTVAYFGGSVTAGHGSSDKEKTSWRAMTTDWFEENFPDAQITEINAAIGESGTFLGTYIVEDYIIAKNPDLVFIEYAINDTYGGFDETQAAYQCETIVREIRSALPDTDIVMLISIDTARAQYEWFYPTAKGHARIAEAYGIPLIFMGKALSDYIAETDGETWEKYFLDIVHPIDAGYAFYFDTVKEYLTNSLFCDILYNKLLPRRELPDLVSEHLMDGSRTLVYATSDILEGNDGWRYYASQNINPMFSQKGSVGAVISADMPEFTYTFYGTELSVYTNIYSPSQFKVTVDGNESVGVFSGHNPTTVVKDLEPGMHTVKIKPISDTISGVSTMYIDAVMYRDASQQTVK